VATQDAPNDLLNRADGGGHDERVERRYVERLSAHGVRREEDLALLRVAPLGRGRVADVEGARGVGAPPGFPHAPPVHGEI